MDHVTLQQRQKLNITNLTFTQLLVQIIIILRSAGFPFPADLISVINKTKRRQS